MDLKTTALFAGFGSIGLLWGQIRSLFTRLTSVLIVNVDLIGHTETAVVRYCWKHFKASRLGTRRFTGFDIFIKPKNRQGVAAFEMTSTALTFFKGWRPLFLSGNVSKEGDYKNGCKISFIRGTFDLEKFIVEAVKEHDEQMHGENESQKRFYIKKYFGAQRDRKRGDDEIESSTKPTSGNGSFSAENRPIGWLEEELGFPSSKTPFVNLAYGKEVRNFEKEIHRWKESEKWFKDRGLPWRFGGGLFGPPGTGKSSFVRAVGQKLDMPIHIYDLTTMSNEELCRFWENSLSCAPCIVLFEDIDRIFDQDKNIKTSANKSPLTLDCLLNCINGVQTSDGILTLITANDPSKIDPALGVADETGKSTRPGRLDRSVYFGILDIEGRTRIANRILAGFEDLIPQIVADGESETGAQFESRCSKIALDRYWNNNEHP